MNTPAQVGLKRQLGNITQETVGRSEAMKGESSKWRKTGKGLVKKSAKLVAPGICTTVN